MADSPSPFQFEDVPLDEARRMGRGPRMEPMLYETLPKRFKRYPPRPFASLWARRSGRSA